MVGTFIGASLFQSLGRIRILGMDVDFCHSDLITHWTDRYVQSWQKVVSIVKRANPLTRILNAACINLLDMRPSSTMFLAIKTVIAAPIGHHRF